jgi:hypothetical protein
MAREHRHGVPGNVHSGVVETNVENGTPRRDLVSHQFGPAEGGRPERAEDALGRTGSRVLVDPDVGRRAKVSACPVGLTKGGRRQTPAGFPANLVSVKTSTQVRETVIVPLMLAVTPEAA